MFKPVFVPVIERKIMSLYKSSIAINAGALVDIDTTDTTAINASGLGFGTLYAGSLKLATPPALAAIAAAQVYNRELGVAIPTVNSTGPLLIERMLQLASSYMTIAQGLNVAVYLPTPGDIIATTEYVGFLGGGDHGTGWIDITSTGNLGAACEVFTGRFRLAQAGNPCRARYLGNTSANGSVLAMFQFA
jgi:hypothetical protein